MDPAYKPFIQILSQVAPALVMVPVLYVVHRNLSRRNKQTHAAFETMAQETGGKLSFNGTNPALHLTWNGATVWLFTDVTSGRSGSAYTKIKARGFPAGSFTMGVHSRSLAARSMGKSVKALDEEFDRRFSASIAASAINYAPDILSYEFKDAMKAFQDAAAQRGFLQLEGGELTLGMTGKITEAAALKQFYDAGLKVMDELKKSLAPVEHLLAAS